MVHTSSASSEFLLLLRACLNSLLLPQSKTRSNPNWNNDSRCRKANPRPPRVFRGLALAGCCRAAFLCSGSMLPFIILQWASNACMWKVENLLDPQFSNTVLKQFLGTFSSGMGLLIYRCSFYCFAIVQSCITPCSLYPVINFSAMPLTREERPGHQSLNSMMMVFFPATPRSINLECSGFDFHL
jgi:hypothetical protein